ncbi:EsV-1-170 [Ectocarpus siliculosus]|uniref:EsV-1-170 n=1 Tax=Ectocarpus siliculosus TaxID=2880 RepID=D8LP47_ECTSI|nr:EsV-1-170 [Ectocarpus siliculosus]|eukprot:CBN80318.1 EsV-1-170 [Ectocarpus siliculosus]
MTKPMSPEIYDAFKKCDGQWMQRRRKLDTSSLFYTLTKCCIQERGVAHILRMENEQYSSQAIHSARKKLPPGAFKEVNRFLQRGPHEPRVFAVDGSKVHVHPSFIGAGYMTRTNNKPVPRPAKRPLVMLSSMVDVKTKACVDFELTKHFNERKAATEMLRGVRKGDTLVFDRGYYSKNLLRSVHDSHAFGVWRLKIDAFKGTRSFFNSCRTEAACLILGIEARLLKYFIDGKTYVCLTNDPSLSRRDIKTMYASRWRVEESFKRLKSNLRLEKAHARTPDLYIQEVEARVLLDTITLRMQGSTKESSYLYTLDTHVTYILRNVKRVSGPSRYKCPGVADLKAKVPFGRMHCRPPAKILIFKA